MAKSESKRKLVIESDSMTVEVKLTVHTPSVRMKRDDRMFLNTVMDTIEAWEKRLRQNAKIEQH